jgi:hypothetical protein
MPSTSAHYKFEAFLNEYLRTAGIADDERRPLFRCPDDRAGCWAWHRACNARSRQGFVEDLRLVSHCATRGGKCAVPFVQEQGGFGRPVLIRQLRKNHPACARKSSFAPASSARTHSLLWGGSIKASSLGTQETGLWIVGRRLMAGEGGDGACRKVRTRMGEPQTSRLMIFQDARR